jgi:oxaloacetate decarboxylase gamma subunit
MNDISALFIEAGTLMLAGMCFVFIFLGLLVLVIKFVLTPLAVRFPDPAPKARKFQPAQTSSNDAKLSPSLVAAISSAVSQYRKNNSN